MIMHSFDSLVHSQAYFNVPNSIKDQLTHYLGHRLSSIWLDLYSMSRRGQLEINKAYSLFAKIWGCCRRTAIRAISRLERAGFIKKTYNDINGFDVANTYIVCIPDSLMAKINSYPTRKQPMPEIDYSVNQDLSTDTRGDTFVTDLIVVNKDINNITEPKPAITVLRQEEDQKTPKSVPKAAINKLRKFIKGQKDISSPAELLDEAIHFVGNQRLYDNPWAAVGAFKKILKAGIWRTPFGMRYEK